jgi:hypothetical protein
VAIEKKERQALLDMLWERAVLTVHGADNQGEPIDADEAWRELKASLAAAGFELDLTVIEGKEAPAV